MTVRSFLLLCGCFLFSLGEILAQKTCGTVVYQDILRKGSEESETKEAFEQWMSAKLRQQSLAGEVARSAETHQVITIPVVIHIIHNGETVGSGSNIPESRVTEQIQRLNEDFRRLNADAANTPAEYLGVAADTEIEFILAKRDPYGLPTTGINRVAGTRPVYDLVHNTELKGLSYWPAEDYMNLWVAELENLLGFAQFPLSSSLQGLEIASENRLTDGVVIDTDFFGINPGLTPESIGRTSTHEIGHFLGLRHIWGDGGCSADDYCDDTPRSNNSNFGCPDANSCGSDDMVENYMDLSDDLCMNLFTMCQKNRMQVVLNNSPRRATLATSSGALPPVMAENDAGIREILIPQANTCTPSVTPQAQIQNMGTNDISTFTVELLVNDNPVENLQIDNSLAPLEITTVSFSEIVVTDMMKVQVVIKQTNAVADGNPENNAKDLVLNAKSFESLPILETLTTIPEDWVIRNDDNSITWEIANAPTDIPSNTAARINFFNYDNSNGEYDYLVSPALDLTTYTGLTLEFDLAYGPFSFGDRDGLIVAISQDCGNSFPEQHYAYFKQGMDLATAPVSAGAFVPSGRSDWRTESISLDQYAGSSHLKIAFIAVNDFGNNLYIDNISIFGTRLPDIDMGVVQVIQPSGILCPAEVAPGVLVRNTGLNPISNFQLSYSLETGENDLTAYSGPALAPGEEELIVFDPVAIQNGSGKITVSIEQVEGQGTDGMPGNNSAEQFYQVNNNSDLVPNIEMFQQPLESTNWSLLNPDGGITWSVTAASGTEDPQNQASYMNFYDYDLQGELDYLASPVLDFSGTISPTMTFDLAYAGNSNFSDGLLILASTDCGVNYADTLFQAFGNELATTTSNSEFFPDNPSDWELQQIDLTDYAGEPAVRIAFLGINDFGNNLFIDNIQFFVSNQTKSLELDQNQMIAFPNPSPGDFTLTFNLSQRSDVNLRIVDSTGREIWSHELQDILNQSLEVQLPGATGLFILQATSSTFNATTRIIVL